MHPPFAKKSSHTRRRNRFRARHLRFEPLEDRHLLATFSVTNLDDAGPGSLRQAVLEANAAAGADEIGFEAGLTGKIALTSGQIDVTEALTVSGPGADKITIDAQQYSRIFMLPRGSGLVTFDGLTLTGGTTDTDGGAILALSNQSYDDVLAIRNSVISGNTAASGGGGVYGYRVDVSDSTISANEAGSDGGGIRSYMINVRSSTVTGNTAGGLGGAIHGADAVEVEASTVADNHARYAAISSYRSVTVTGATVANNTAERGAGVYVAGELRLQDSVIRDNISPSGSGVTATGRVVVTGCTIAGNSGAAVESQFSTVTVIGSELIENGGGAFSDGNMILRDSSIVGNAFRGLHVHGNLTVTNSVITGNAGDGILTDGQLNLTDSTVNDNAGLGVRGRGSTTVLRSTISGNAAGGIHGGIEVAVTQSNINENGGAGVDAFSSVTVLGSTIAENAGTGVNSDRDLTISDSTISGNEDGGVAGYLTIAITGSTISNNSAQSHGGGINARRDVTVVDSTISGNSAGNHGGGIYMSSSGDLTITNSTISGNTAIGNGGGIRANRSRITISNSTITGNSAFSGAGGIVAEQAEALTIHSSIVAGNLGTTVCALSFPSRCFTVPADISRLDAIEVAHSLIGDANGTNLNEAPLGFPDADGNLIGDSRGSGAIDPLLGPLQDNGGPTETHLLLAGSPALDTGANLLDLEFDQRGLPRQFSAAVDMGAVEVHPVIFVVDSTGDGGDANPGDGVCGDDAGSCTLRAAIEEANALVNSAFPDEIHFAISGDGPHTIQPLSPLPTIRDAVIIDGTSQSSISTALSAFDDPLHIEIDGSLAGEGASGLKINRRGGDSTIRGLIVNRFDAHGIFISRSDGNHVGQNLIGTDPTGTVALGNGNAGVMIINGADNVLGGSLTAGGGNVVSANRRGIVIAGRLASGNQVLGNLIGVDASGVVALGNRGAGVEISGAPNNHVGATVATADGINVISGNRTGVEIRSSAATGNTLALNKIGTDLSATVVLPNRIGVSIRNGASASQVLGNQIAGNLGDGVNLTRADGNRIDANQIGGDGLGNGGDGVDIRGGQGNVVGGNLAIASNASGEAVLDLAQGNRISGNGGYGVNVVGDGNLIQFNTIGKVSHDQEGNRRGGIQILNSSNNAVRENEIFKNQGPGVLINGSTATANVIQGNSIGFPKFHLGKRGLPDLGNTVGIEVRNAHDNLIGGSEAVEGNLISNNDRYGVQIHGAASGNRVQGNEIGVGSQILSFPPVTPILLAPADQVAPLPGPVPSDLGSIIFRMIPAPNGRDGVFVESDGNVIGGATDGAGNIIGGNGRHGVLLTGNGNRIEGNTIGTGVSTVFELPNAGDGIRIRGSNNVVGGAADETGSAANTIAFNSGSGVRVSSGTGNAVTQNSIFDNDGLGIDLGRMGSNANDGPLDADSGANNLQNSPQILTTRQTATHLQIIFHIPSQPPHSAFPMRAEFFLADDDGEEGQTFLASTDVALFTPTVISIRLADLPPGAQLLATATDAGGNTSEFSAAFAAGPLPAASAAQQAADLIFRDLGQ